ncbi:MAG: arginine deiminase family protein [Bacillota bacterium]|uniref:Arginine deiminase n=1 Tax=Virgibacillus salarius TaxID=447199 RepID=A0A941DTK7_9BACI|nr:MULTISPECIES: arginine deiminase family protein [Bacillaceae]NAZ07863.1 arginine deiminase [Agaribacter marinus]MBR7795147.1 arginine deiminase [Virgibacillus salarius]MCC2249350.1 arginine deiminase [Virgibacillus sp. AGTR]MDY7042966.1 arginine deiminase family protein [Virgibacillus sp. M23]QRZ18849.1 arginine deiminase [Virgibacillus sp. AGTR]
MLAFEPNCWSEHDVLETVLVCAPSMVSIPDIKTAEEVQWSAPVNYKKAHENFLELKAALQNAGVQVIDYSAYLTKEDQQLSDQLINRFFVRDLACVFGNTILPGEAGTSMRRPEYVQAHVLMDKWFPNSFRMHENNYIKALEYGDVLLLNRDAVWINVGMRTSIESVEQIKQSIFAAGFSEIGIISLPRRTDTLHLDMNCNVASKDVVVSKSFVRHFPIHVWTERASRYEMPEQFLNRHGFEVYWLEEYNTIPDINFLNLNPETILISKQAHKQRLRSHPKLQRKNIIEIEVTELEKAGGGIRCMTLPLQRKSSM